MQDSIKHANCKNILAKLDSTSNSIRLKLEDDGIGFNIDEPKFNGIGLQNIKKRTELIGGKITLESKEKVGAKLIIEIPL